MQLLGDARSNVERQPDALLRHTLLRKIDKIQFVVDCWGAMPPHPEQISAMLEMILGLHDATELRSHDRGAT